MCPEEGTDSAAVEGTLRTPREFVGMCRLGGGARAGRTAALEQEQQLHARRPDHPAGHVQRPGAAGTDADPGALAAARHALGQRLEAALIEGIPLRRVRFGAASLNQDRRFPVFGVNAEAAVGLLRRSIRAGHGAQGSLT